MSSIVGTDPEGNGAPLLSIILNDDQRRVVHPEQVRDEQSRAALQDECATSSTPAVFIIDVLLDWDPEVCWLALLLISGTPSALCQVSETSTERLNLFDASKSLLEGPDNVQRCERARSIAIQAAALVHPTAVDPTASSIKARLQALGVQCDIRQIRNEITGLIRSHQAAQRPGQGSESRLVIHSLPDAPVSGTAVVPAGWQLDASGVARLNEEGHAKAVMPDPAVIVGRSKNIVDGTEAVGISWVRDGGWQNITVPRATIATSHSIVDLAGKGLPVTSNNAPDVVQYFADFETQNLELLRPSQISHRLGWIGNEGDQGFLLGRNLITAPGAVAGAISFSGADVGDDQLVDGYCVSGTDAGWVAAIGPLVNYPRVQLAIYAALVPPLLSIFKAPNFIFSFAGPTSLGKTTALRLAASIWGCPDERAAASVMSGWNATRTYVERSMGVVNCIPMFLDDTKRATNEKDIAQIVYDVSAGRGRGRGSRAGIAESTTYQTVLISTGESQLASFTEDGGTRARILELYGSPFHTSGADTAAVVACLNTQIQQHYGHAAIYFLQQLVNRRANWPQLRARYEQHRQRYENMAINNPVAGRMASNFACLEMAAELAHELRILPWPYQGTIANLWPEITAETLEADRALAALQYLLSWCHSHRDGFFDPMRTTYQPAAGWAGVWEVPRTSSANDRCLAIYPSKLQEILLAGNFEPAPTRRNWLERGWLRTSLRKSTLKIRMGDQTSEVVALRWSAIHQQIGEPDVELLPSRPLLPTPTQPTREHANGRGTETGTP